MTSPEPAPDISSILAALRIIKREAAAHSDAPCLTPRATVVLKRLVIQADGITFGFDVHSLAELALRAQILGLLVLLDDLCKAMRHASTRCQHLYAGRLGAFSDVFRYLFDEVLPEVYRRSDGVQNSSDGTAYEARIRAAQAVIASIAADPDFAYFLRQGCVCSDAEQVQRTCIRLQELLTYRIELVPRPETNFSLLPLFDDAIPCAGAIADAS